MTIIKFPPIVEQDIAFDKKWTIHFGDEGRSIVIMIRNKTEDIIALIEFNVKEAERWQKRWGELLERIKDEQTKNTR